MSERENILGRIREALSIAAPRPSPDGHIAQNGPDAAGPKAIRQFLPAVGESSSERLEVFQKNAAALKAEFLRIESMDQLIQHLRMLRDTEGWTKVASHSGKLTDAACAELSLPVLRTDPAYNVKELEACSAGITECDALVAQTGSVLLTSRSAGGRAVSVLPPHHLVLARREQIVRDLPEAFSLLKTRYGANYPSFISFTTGPSRTGDIERILVLGAHGPKKLTILCL